jgi:hypothetical protein
MKKLKSLKVLIKNPKKIYKYDKVILNNQMCVDNKFSNDIYSYLNKIFGPNLSNLKTLYLKSFKYFIKICENIEFQFVNNFNYTFIYFLSNYLDSKYNKKIKHLFIYIIKKYKLYELYTISNYNMCNYISPNMKIRKQLSYEVFKYFISFNIYFNKNNTYYEYPVIINSNGFDTKYDLLLLKTKKNQDIWRKRRLFILLCLFYFGINYIIL